MWNQSKSKFGNKKVTFGNETFDSKGEWQRWLFLKEAEKNGQINDLERQVKFTLVPAQYKPVEVKLKTKTKVEQRLVTRAVTYTADFVYWKRGKMKFPLGEVLIYERVVEDYKGQPNDRWPIKKALMLSVHGIEVREVKKPTEPI